MSVKKTMDMYPQVGGTDDIMRTGTVKKTAMRSVLIRVCLICMVFLSCRSMLQAQMDRPITRKNEPAPEISADILSLFELNYLASDNRYSLGIPLYTEAALRYEDEMMEARMTVEFHETVTPGDTYIRGGSGDSFMKAGYYRENWGTGRPVSIIDILNLPDDRYPSTLFYSDYRSPNPLFTLSVGEDEFVSQAAVSLVEGSESIDDALIGLQFFSRQGGSTVGIGMIRYAGFPPPLFFLKAKIDEEKNSAWLEAGWWYKKDSPDRVDFIIGASQTLERALVTAEFILQSSSPLFFLQESFIFTEPLSFTIGGFTYLRTFSSAVTGYFTIGFTDSAAVDLGTFLFFGKPGSFFSRYDGGDNNNSVYLRFRFIVPVSDKNGG